MKLIVKGCGALLSVSLLAFAGCESAEKEASLSPGAMASMDAGGEYDSNLAYLLSKYDADGDQQISAAEYDRDGGQFERLDKDEDGFISSGDFQRGGGMQARMDAMKAQRAFAAHFQSDDANETMTLGELEGAIASYDADANGVVSADEFNSNAADRKVALPGDDNPMMRRMDTDDPYGTIAGKADENADGALASTELVAYFEANSSDGEMTIRSPFGNRNRRRGGDDEPAEYVEPTDGAMMGETAPDFALQGPDGGETVTLSSFRNNLPVALIFGSYT